MVEFAGVAGGQSLDYIPVGVAVVGFEAAVQFGSLEKSKLVGNTERLKSFDHLSHNYLGIDCQEFQAPLRNFVIDIG